MLSIFSLVYNIEKGGIRYPPGCEDSHCAIRLNAMRQQTLFLSVIKINMLGKNAKDRQEKSSSERNAQMIFDLTTVDHDFKLQFNCHIDKKEVMSMKYRVFTNTLNNYLPSEITDYTSIDNFALKIEKW